MNIQKQVKFLRYAPILLFPFLVLVSFFLLFPETQSIGAQEQSYSSRLVLLSPSLHSDPNPSRGGSDIVIKDSLRLVAQGADDRLFIPKTDQISLYTVRPGDNLSQIADLFEVSVNTIRWANDLGSSNTISSGDELIILPVSGIKHVVKKQDTFESLAKKFDSDATEIALFNGLSEKGLIIGDEIIIPNGEIHVEAPTRKSTSRSSSSIASNNGGYFTHPAPGSRRTQGIHGRNGLDFGAPIGTPVYAAASGSVIISRPSGWNGGYGQYIVIKHENGTQTLYSHLSSNQVAVGDWVTKGSRIGSIGNTGKSTGPHLHFEVRGGTNPF